MAETKERVRVKAGTGVAQLPARSGSHAPATLDNQSILAVLARAAADPHVDPAKMREIYQIQKDIALDQAKIEFDEAFVDLQAELPVINKDGRIEVRAKDAKGDRTGPVQQSSPFASFENMMDVVQPLLTKYRFGLSFSTEPAPDGRLLVIGMLSRKGHERKTIFPLPADTTGSKNNAQGWGSAQSYGKRYGMIALLNIRSRFIEDRDTDGHKGTFKEATVKVNGTTREALAETTVEDLVSDEQTMKLRELVEWCGVPLATFCDHFGIKKIADLPARFFETAKKDCEEYKANQDRKAERARSQDQGGRFR